MTQTVTLELSEAQIVGLVRRLSPEARRKVLKALVPRLGQLDALQEYGEERIRVLSAQRGLDWDVLSEAERERLVDELLHEA
jgi:thioester reductase-like protein